MLGIVHSISDVLALIVLFGFTIFVHELGHFLVALWCGMLVDTFSIGFGPAIWQKQIRGIRFKISWIPFGGYVALPQLDPSGMSTVQGSEKGEKQTETGPASTAQVKPDEARVLPPVAFWKKILVSLAGATGNIMFAFLLAWVIFMSPEDTSDKNGGRALVGFVDTNSMAYAAGVRAGDEIVGVNGETIRSWSEYSVLCLLGTGRTNAVVLTLANDSRTHEVTVPTVAGDMGAQLVDGIGKSLACVVNDIVDGLAADKAGVKPGDIVRMCDGTVVASTEHFIDLIGDRRDQEVSMTVERNGELLTLLVTPEYDPVRDQVIVGVHIGSDFEELAMPWMQYKHPWQQIKSDAGGIIRILRALVTPREAGQAAKGLGGPVMILAALWIAIKISLLNGVGFLRFLNVNLAILNLLPIPVLDGGHIVFALWEGITRRKAHPKVVNVLVNVFATLLIGVLILLSLRDIIRAPRMLRAFGLLKPKNAAEQVEPETQTEENTDVPGSAADEHGDSGDAGEVSESGGE